MYQATMNSKNKSRYIGLFPTPELAKKAYDKEKYTHMMNVISEQMKLNINNKNLITLLESIKVRINEKK